MPTKSSIPVEFSRKLPNFLALWTKVRPKVTQFSVKPKKTRGLSVL